MLKRYLFIFLILPLLAFESTEANYKTFYENTYAVGDKILVTGIVFDVDQDGINPVCYDTIKQISDFLLRHPEWEVEIGVHTDDLGSARHNRVLSDRRARQIAYQIVSTSSVEFYRPHPMGYGEQQPLIPLDTIMKRTPEEQKALRARNSRVEVKILYIK